MTYPQVTSQGFIVTETRIIHVADCDYVEKTPGQLTIRTRIDERIFNIMFGDKMEEAWNTLTKALQ